MYGNVCCENNTVIQKQTRRVFQSWFISNFNSLQFLTPFTTVEVIKVIDSNIMLVCIPFLPFHIPLQRWDQQSTPYAES